MRKILCLFALGACTFDDPPDVHTHRIELVSGDAQQGVVGTALAEPLVVALTGPDGPVENFTLDFTVAEGGGSLAEPTVRTDAQGQARVALTLGTRAGTNAVRLDLADTVGAPLTFTATGLAGNGMAIEIANDDQVGVVATQLAQPLVATVVDAYGNTVSGATVQFEVSTNDGQLSSSSGTSDAAGRVSTTFTLGRAAGLNEVTASGTGLTGATFSATGTPDVPFAIAPTTLGTLSAIAGAAVATPLEVLVTDRFGNAVPGAIVSFAVTTGIGSVAPATATTDAAGHASTVLTTGVTVGPNGVSATVAGVAAAASFSATGLVGPPAEVVIVSGDDQVGVLGQALAAPLVVRVRDTHGNLVPNTPISFAVTKGGGSLGGASAATNGAGIAQVSLTLGTATGRHAVEATAGTGKATLEAKCAAFDVQQLVVTSDLGIRDLVMADFDGDQRPDLAAITQGNGISLFLNRTVQNTGIPVWAGGGLLTVNGTNAARALVTADFNQDGKPDLAMVTAGSLSSGIEGGIAIFINTSAGGVTSFAPPVFAGGLFDMQAIAVADLNADGAPDIVFGKPGSAVLGVLMNTTSANQSAFSFVFGGNINTGIPILNTSDLRALALGDFDGDNRPDLAVLGDSNVAVVLNKTMVTSMTASFGAAAVFPVGPNVRAIAVGDTSGDGKPDIVVARELSVAVLVDTTSVGATAASFTTTFPISGGARALALADFHGSGRLDVAAASNSAAQFAIHLNAGTSFVSASFAGASTATIVAGDINGDGMLDVVYLKGVSLEARLAK